MPVSADVQSAISLRYAQLANSITHGDATGEKTVLAPSFVDRSKAKLDSFENDPLTVLVQRIDSKGSVFVVHAQYVGVHGHNANTVDIWKNVNGQWLLVSRT